MYGPLGCIGYIRGVEGVPFSGAIFWDHVTTLRVPAYEEGLISVFAVVILFFGGVLLGMQKIKLYAMSIVWLCVCLGPELQSQCQKKTKQKTLLCL